MQREPWHIEILGGLRVCREGQSPIDLPRQQTGALLAYLALGLNRSHTREELMAVIWPEDTPETARHKLRQSLYALRRQLGPSPPETDSILLTTRATVQLNVGLVTTDAAWFERSLRDALHTADLATRISFLTEALSLYRGELLPGFYQETFLAERSRLAELYRNALHRLTLAYECAGDLNHAIETARRTLALDPLMEEIHCDLMRLYAAAGQPSAVLRQYQELTGILEEAMGEEPSQSTRLMVESLRQTAQANAASHKTNANSHANGAPSAAPAASREENTPVVSVAVQPVTAVSASLHTLPAKRGWFQSVVALCGAGLCLLLAWQMLRRRDQPTGGPVSPVLWMARYQPQAGDKGSEATAVKTDLEGKVYVAGFVDTVSCDVDFLTIKYDPYGKLLWQKRYNGPGNDVDRARAIAVDNQGCVYVTGESDNGKGNGTSRMAGTDFATIKYEPDGTPSPTWPDVGFGVGVRRYNGPGDGEDRPDRLLVDASGVYVLGRSWGRGKTGNGGFNIALVKYDRYGAEQWTFRYDGGYGDDVPADMAIDPDGSIYITGQSRDEPPSGPESDMLTLKISKDGKRVLWERRYGENNLADDRAVAIGLDGGGNVIIVGEGLGLPGTPDAARTGYLVVKYAPNGRRQWVRGAMEERDRIETVIAAQISLSGEVAVAGLARDAHAQICRTVMRDSNGLHIWAADFGQVAGEDGPTSVAIDAKGTLLCGAIRSPDHDPGLFALRYNRVGQPTWQHCLGVPEGRSRADAITSYHDDPIVVGQTSDGKTAQWIVIKYRR